MVFDLGNSIEQQKKEIQITDGPLLIITGPGTGKPM
jgi:superfamily I DNA/RNA helicase